MDAIVKMATTDDIEDLIKVRFAYFEAEKWDVTNEQRVEITSNLRRYFSKQLNNNFFAALVKKDDEIVSVAFLAISEVPANLSFPTGKTGVILNVLTYPNHRKKGYATCTMCALIEEAKRQNLSYITLSASEAGKPLYRKLGFCTTEPSSQFTDMKLLLAK